MIDEFLLIKQSTQTIHLLFTVRDTRKLAQTLAGINEHLNGILSRRGKDGGSITRLEGERIIVEGVLVDLTRLLTVRSLAYDLCKREQHIDAIVCNAGIGGWTGLDWPRATWTILTDFMQAVTFPTYQASSVGAVTKQQVKSNDGQSQEPALGEVFTANVFGHYMLVHWLSLLMNAQSRIIWTSSLSAQPRYFVPDDFQHLNTTESYESSKRITDLLVLTSELSSTRPYVTSFFSVSSTTTPPTMYLVHPGIVKTAISMMPWFLHFIIVAVFYVARMAGSPWHTVLAYPGATSAVWVCLAPDSQLRAREVHEGKGKWGSVVDTQGNEGVKRTEVEGWGFNGIPGDVPPGSVSGKQGRYRERRPTTKESREHFEEHGMLAWREMEDLRTAWEKRLGPAL